MNQPRTSRARPNREDTDRQHGASGNERIRYWAGETDTDGQIVTPALTENLTHRQANHGFTEN